MDSKIEIQVNEFNKLIVAPDGIIYLDHYEYRVGWRTLGSFDEFLKAYEKLEKLLVLG